MPRDMVRGLKGEDVRALQQGLNEYFAYRRDRLVPDGDFGSRTQAAVHAFQEENPETGDANGKPDGIVGSRSLRRLFPLVGYTVNIYAMRLKMPNYRPTFGVQPPKVGSGPRLNPQPATQVDWMRLLPGMLNPTLDLKPTKFPGLAKPLSIPPPRTLSSSGLPSLLPRPFQLPRPNNFELAAGGKFSTGKPPEVSASVSLSAVYVMGDLTPHYEFQTGFELGTPNAIKNEGWTFGWFAQFAAVDFFWKYGQFHLAQPYAQLGADATEKGMVLKSSLTPLNIDFDITKGIAINAQAGFVGSWKLKEGLFEAGFETGVGVTFSTEFFDP